MAAEKLTKYRLGQIIVILCVLVIAFIWRTYTYQNAKHINCIAHNPCRLNVEGKHITITKDISNPALISVFPFEKHWTIEIEQGASSMVWEEHKGHFQVTFKPSQADQFTLNTGANQYVVLMR
jgi:hypothetical protein